MSSAAQRSLQHDGQGPRGVGHSTSFRYSGLPHFLSSLVSDSKLQPSPSYTAVPAPAPVAPAHTPSPSPPSHLLSCSASAAASGPCSSFIPTNRKSPTLPPRPALLPPAPPERPLPFLRCAGGAGGGGGGGERQAEKMQPKAAQAGRPVALLRPAIGTRKPAVSPEQGQGRGRWVGGCVGGWMDVPPSAGRPRHMGHSWGICEYGCNTMHCTAQTCDRCVIEADCNHYPGSAGKPRAVQPQPAPAPGPQPAHPWCRWSTRGTSSRPLGCSCWSR